MISISKDARLRPDSYILRLQMVYKYGLIKLQHFNLFVVRLGPENQSHKFWKNRRMTPNVFYFFLIRATSWMRKRRIRALLRMCICSLSIIVVFRCYPTKFVLVSASNFKHVSISYVVWSGLHHCLWQMLRTNETTRHQAFLLVISRVKLNNLTKLAWVKSFNFWKKC